jgi:hypothetical protein
VLRATYQVSGLTSWIGYSERSNAGSIWATRIIVGTAIDDRTGAIGQYGTGGSGPLNGTLNFTFNANINSSTPFTIYGKASATVGSGLAANADATGRSDLTIRWLGFTVTDTSGSPLAFTTTSDSGRDWSQPMPVPPQVMFENSMAAAGLAGADAQADAIPFHDSVPNLLKYAFNMNLAGPEHRTLTPQTGTGGLPAIRIVDGTLRYEFLRRKNSGLIYTPQQSSDLSGMSWQGATGTTTVASIDADWERVEIQQSMGTSRFFRVSVTLP